MTADTAPDLDALGFASAVRAIGAVLREHRCYTPAFRSPPTRPGLDRTIRERPVGNYVVAVRRLGRPLEDVLGDLVDGALKANEGRECPARADLLDAARAAVDVNVRAFP